MSQVSSHELFLIEAKKKALAYVEWKKDSDRITAELIAESRAGRAAHSATHSRLQQIVQDFIDDAPAYRLCPYKAPMYEQNLNAAGKCQNCSVPLCSGDVAATCGPVCGCKWSICSKCMTNWLESFDHSDSYEEDSEPDQNESEEDQPAVHEQDVHQVIDQFIEEQLYQTEPEGDHQNIEGDEQPSPVDESPGTIIDVEGTVHNMPSAARFASNKKLYEEAKSRNQHGFKPCGRCSFPQGMRSKKCKDKDHCTFVMIKAAEYKKRVKSTAERNADKEERHNAAVLRLKTDYYKEVDSEQLYEDYKDELPFVDDRNQVLTLVFCCT